MTDTFITSGPEETPGSGSTVTIEPPQTGGVGDVDPNTGSVPGQSESGGEQSSADGSQPTARTGRKWSIQDEVKELRAQRRELREQVRASEETREELRQLREELNRQRQPNVEKVPANFFADPEARLQALKDELKEVVAEQNKGLMEAFHQTREQEHQQQVLRQEQASATEFIRAQKGYDASDDEELVEIIETIPNKQHLSPQWVAEYAWLKLNQSRGIGDKSVQKQRAAGVQGQPPGVGFGRKSWSKAEFDQALDQVEKAPHDPKNAELIKELESAHKEGRVKN